MPKIPTYDAPQVETRALPGVRQSSVASPSLFGAAAEQQIALGKGLMQAGGRLGEFAAKLQAEDNETEAKALDTEFANFGRDVLNGANGDPSTGYLSRQGKTALDEYGKAQEALDKKRQELIGKASNDRVRDLVGRTFDQRMLGFRDTMDGHARTQRRAHMEVTSKLRTDALTEDMADNWADPAKHATYLAGLRAEAASLADLNGITDPKEREAFTRDFTTKGHASVLTRMLSIGYADEAEKYLKEHGAGIDGKVRDQFKEKIEVVGGLKKQQTAADTIMGMGLDEGAALSYIEKNYEGKDEQRIKQEVKMRFAEQKGANDRKQKALYDQARVAILKGAGAKGIAGLVAEMDPGTRAETMEYLDVYARRRTAEANKDAKADLDDITNLDKVERLIEQGDITQRGQLALYAPYFSKGTLKTLATKIDKRGAVPPAEIRRVFEERKGAKVNVGKMNDNERAEWMAFQQYVLDNVKETRRPEDIDVWADRWFMSGYGKDDSVFTNDPDTYGEARVKGRKDFVISTPQAAQAGVDSALGILAKNGVAMPKDKKLARDEFYTTHALEAERWAAAHGMPSSPELTAAYALLKQAKKPVTAGNLDYVMKQLKK